MEEQKNITISPETVEVDSNNYNNSRSLTVLSKMCKGHMIDDSLWMMLDSDVGFASSLFQKMPNSYQKEKIRLAEIIIKKVPGKLSVLIEASKDDATIQSQIFDLYEERLKSKSSV